MTADTITTTAHGKTRTMPVNTYGEPTVDFVVDTWSGVPQSIAGHAFMGSLLPGVYRHSRLGIMIVVLNELLAALDDLKAKTYAGSG